MLDTERRTNPFPGLRSFEADEDHLFFGRESRIDSEALQCAVDAEDRVDWEARLVTDDAGEPPALEYL